MKKRINFKHALILISLGLSIWFIACSKEKSNSEGNATIKSSSHSIGSMEDMDEQLKWIAKGVASRIYEDSDLKDDMHAEYYA